jgi:hypothetical protein
MKNKPKIWTTKDDLLVNMTIHKVSAFLLAEFAEQIVQPYYNGNLNVAIKDLIHKALAEQDFLLSHVTHIRNQEAQLHG